MRPEKVLPLTRENLVLGCENYSLGPDRLWRISVEFLAGVEGRAGSSRTGRLKIPRRNEGTRPPN